MNKFAVEVGYSISKIVKKATPEKERTMNSLTITKKSGTAAEILENLKSTGNEAYKELNNAISSELFGESSPRVFATHKGGEPYQYDIATTKPGDPLRAPEVGTTLGGIGGLGVGGVAGAGAGGLLHYLLASNKNRGFKDYLLSMLAGGGAGALGGGALGATAGLGLGKARLKQHEGVMEYIQRKNIRKQGSAPIITTADMWDNLNG